MTPDALAELYARAAPDAAGWRSEDFRDVLASPGAVLSVEDHAFALGRVAADEAELILIATDPDHRRQGQAARCLSAFHAKAAEGGATAAFLEVAESNTAARALYDAFGYHQVGRRPGYYASSGGQPETALILRLELTERA